MKPTPTPGLWQRSYQADGIGLLAAPTWRRVKWRQWRRYSQGRVLCEPRCRRSLRLSSQSLTGHTLQGKGSSPRWQERVRGSPEQEAGQRLVPCKVALEKLGEGLLGSGLKVDARCQGLWVSGWPVLELVKEEGPALPP